MSVVLLSLMAIAAVVVLVWVSLKHYELLKRFKPVLDVMAEKNKIEAEIKIEIAKKADLETATNVRKSELDAEIAQAKENADQQRALLAQDLILARDSISNQKHIFENDFKNAQATLSREYTNARESYEQLKKELALLEEDWDCVSCGIYEPHYSYNSTERYKAELARIVAAKKALVRDGTATRTLIKWTVGGSQKEGEKMQKQLSKLMLRAFNGEVDAAINKVSWNNAVQMQERILKSFDAINDQGTVVQVSITTEYRDLAIAELRLKHELEEKKKSDADEQKRIREQMKEEEQALREIERAQEESVQEENRYEKALAKAKADMAKASEEQAVQINAKIAMLEAQLAEAHAKAERTKSMAQMTKSGHVYIISNMGSFGESVYKIGMTRRLEPMDRVKELGDASVPFEFDVHALVWSEDAPALENALHRHFNAHRVNLVNMKKEFFRVDLSQVEDFLVQRGLTLQITKMAEAREYRESQALLSLKEL